MSEEIKPVLNDEVLLQENRNLQILQRSLSGALKEVFGEYTESQRFLDLKRVPLICKDIQNIVKMMEDEKKERHIHNQEVTKKFELIDEKINNKYVTTDMLEARIGTPIKLVYGSVALILVEVVTAILYLVLKK